MSETGEEQLARWDSDLDQIRERIDTAATVEELGALAELLNDLGLELDREARRLNNRMDRLNALAAEFEDKAEKIRGTSG